MGNSVRNSDSAPGRLAGFVAGRRTKWLVLIVWIIAVAAFGGLASKLVGATQNEAAQWLPGSAESTQAFESAAKFRPADESAVVFVYERPDGITAADTSAAEADVATVRTNQYVIADKILGPVRSEDGKALQVLVPIHTGDGSWTHIDTVVTELKGLLPAKPDGASFHVTGPAAYAGAYGAAFSSADGILLIAAAIVVVIVLLISYGPVLWILPLFSVIAGLMIAQGVVYLATKVGLTVTGIGSSVLAVLVFGAGTDYALLLVARYREELRNHDDRHVAMAHALRRCGPAILASAATVIIATLALTFAEMNSTQGLGPVCAISVAIAFAVSITLLPALLVICNRWVFWPRRVAVGSREPAESGRWSRIGKAISVRPRAVWIGTTIVLIVAALGMIGLETNGIAGRDSLVGQTDPEAGEEALSRHFDAGTGNPVFVIGAADKADSVASALAGVPGVESVEAPVNKDGEFYLEGVLADPPGTDAAAATIDGIRGAVHAVDADAKVGGNPAVLVDTKEASSRDNRVIVPLVLVIVLLILIVLLRSVLAPVLLVGTVVLSYFTALGLSRWLFDLFGFNGADPSLPLLTFVFLVALGIDYNIFLVSRIHQEAQQHGTRRAALIGLTTTGVVITSAGLVLAGTFAVLGTLTLVMVAQMGIVVAVGVLIDTLVVRSILVTALFLDIGPKMWWPSDLAKRPQTPSAVVDPDAQGELVTTC